MRFRTAAIRLAPALPLFLLVAAPPARAQTITLDEGGFRLFLAGREAGTETFSIRRNGTGDDAVIVAQSRTRLETASGEEEITASLEAKGPALRPVAYQLTIQGAQPRRIAGRIAGGRVTARIITGEGEMMREYLAADGAVLLDEGVAHQHYFLARRLDGAAAPRIPVLLPRDSRQAMAKVTASEPETIQVAGRAVSARRLVVEPAGAAARRIWVDDQGRVLRVEVPACSFTAERIAPPG